MENKVVIKLKEFVNKIDRAAGIQLVMIFMTLAAYILLLSIQKYLPSFEGAQSKLVVVNILLGVGLLIEFGYFIWHTNRQGKEETPKKENKISEIENQEHEKEAPKED